jgi:hypothetical protein
VFFFSMGARTFVSLAVASALIAANGRVGRPRDDRPTSAAMAEASSSAEGTADLRVRALFVRALDAAERDAELADASIALLARRPDGETVTAFRCDKPTYSLDHIAREGHFVWLTARDAEDDDDAPPLTIVGVVPRDDGATVTIPIYARSVARALDDGRARSSSRAIVVIHVRDASGRGVPDATARAIANADGPLYDELRGGIGRALATSARGLIAFRDVDASAARDVDVEIDAAGEHIDARAPVEAGAVTTLEVDVR